MLRRCYFEFVLLESCSSVWGSGAECHLQLPERQVYSVARLCLDHSFLLCHRRCELGLVCCSMLIRTVIAVQRACICVYYSSTIFELRPQLIHWSLKYQGVESPNLLGLSCRPRFECGMTDRPYTQWCSQSFVASMSCVFFSFPWRKCLLGCESILWTTLFSHWGLCC